MADPPIQLVYRPTTLRRFQIANAAENAATFGRMHALRGTATA
jgi:hypothetical protein